MKERISETTGYLGKGMIISLLVRSDQGICSVRDLHRIPNGIEDHRNVAFLKIDLFAVKKFSQPKDINAVYDLIHQ